MREHGTDEDGYLFTRRDGKRVGYDSIVVRFRKAAEAAGLGEMTPHNLRHLYVTALLTNGVPITDVSPMLGHRDIGVTSAVYSHLTETAWDRARAVLDTDCAPAPLRAVS